MVMLVSLQQASDHLRRDTNDDDADLNLKILIASTAILNYLKEVDFLDSSGGVETDLNGDPIGVPAAIQGAVLLMVGVFYDDRSSQSYIDNSGSIARLEDMSLPRAVHFLLDPFRTPTLA